MGTAIPRATLRGRKLGIFSGRMYVEQMLVRIHGKIRKSNAICDVFLHYRG